VWENLVMGHLKPLRHGHFVDLSFELL